MMKHLRVAAVLAVVLLALQLGVATAIGFAYRPQTQQGTATSNQQLAPEVQRARQLQQRLVQRIAADLKLNNSNISYSPNSTNQNNWLDSLGACHLGTAAYSGQYTLSLTGSKGLSGPSEARTARAVRNAVSDLLSALPDYSLDNPATPRTIDLPSLNTQLVVLYGSSLQVTANIHEVHGTAVRCFPIGQLPAPSPTPTRTLTIPGQGGEE